MTPQDRDPFDDQHDWILQQKDSGKLVSGKCPLGNQRELRRVIDAIGNRDYGKLKDLQILLGLPLTEYTYTGIRPPEFNLMEQAAVYDAEPLVRRAIQRQLDLWFKEPFQLVGRKAPYVDYLSKRLKQIAFVTRIPTRQLFRTVVRSLLKYSNSFLIVERDSALSGGVRKDWMKVPPIAGLFPVSPLTMFPRFEKGKLIGWVRLVGRGDRYAEYPTESVIHMTLDREEDFVFGKPRLLGGIEDIAALRRIEENVEVLLSRYMFPIYQLTVGTPERPCAYRPDGVSELDAARIQVNQMEQEGMLIVSERMKLDIVGSTDKAMDPMPALAHFKSRVYTDLGVSAIDMGEGKDGTRSTADNISQNLKDKVRADQGEFADMVQTLLFLPFLLEHPEDVSALNAFDSVQLTFHNCDLDNRLKWENHVANLWNNDLKTLDEARNEIGDQPMTDAEWRGTHLNKVEIPLIEKQADLQAEAAQPQLDLQREQMRSQARLQEKQIDLGHEQHKMTLRSQERQTDKGLEAPGAKVNVHVGTQAPTLAMPGTGGGAANKAGGAKGGAGKARPGTPAQRTTQTKAQPRNQHGKNLGPTKKKSAFEADGEFVVLDCGDDALLGPDLSRVVDVLVGVEDAAEAARVVKTAFRDDARLLHILPMVERAFASCGGRAELRATLVAAFGSADGFREDRDEPDQAGPAGPLHR